MLDMFYHIFLYRPIGLYIFFLVLPTLVSPGLDVSQLVRAHFSEFDYTEATRAPHAGAQASNAPGDPKNTV